MEELVAVLSNPTAFEFKPLFEIVYAKLRTRNLVSGGEEMLRLRAYDKLQTLVNQGMVKKNIVKGAKWYRGQKSLAALQCDLSGVPKGV